MKTRTENCFDSFVVYYHVPFDDIFALKVKFCYWKKEKDYAFSTKALLTYEQLVTRILYIFSEMLSYSLVMY